MTSHQNKSLSNSCTLLFIHGFGSTSKYWQPVCKNLSAEICPTYFDLPGHGDRSDYLPKDMHQMLDIVNQFVLSTVNLNAPIALVGHSLGGLISLGYYLRYPERVTHLILISSAARIIIHPELFLQLRKGEIDADFLAQGFTTHIKKNIRKNLIRDMKKIRIQKDVEDLLQLSTINYTDQLSSVNCKTLIIAGNQDKIISPRRTREMALKINNSQIAILETGHYPHLELNKEVASIINNFLHHG
jgi:pimeloyl-ACP methyl ester carboxylesterase